MEGKEFSKPRELPPIPGVVPLELPNAPVSGALKFPQGSEYVHIEDPPPSYSSGPPKSALVADNSIHSVAPVSRQAPWDARNDHEPDGLIEEAKGRTQDGWDPSTKMASASGREQSGGDIGGDITTTYTPPTSWVEVDGRDDVEERGWWDPSMRERRGRPGPGMLPPVLAEELHDSDHSIFSVSVTPPDIRPLNPAPQLAALWNTQLSPSPPRASRSTLPPPPPSDNDVRMSVPHPNAYYCAKENGWFILYCKTSSEPPKLAKSFNALAQPLPSQQRREAGTNCTNLSSANKTHHFHKYEKAFDPHNLTPSFRQENWEIIDSFKQGKRGTTVQDFISEDAQMLDKGGTPQDQEGKLLDLYICCQCSFYCIASGLIPGVVPRRFFEEFVRDRKENPSPGTTSVQAVVSGMETLHMVLENRLWKGENRLLKVGRSSFKYKLGWNTNIKRIFEILGFMEESQDNEPVLRPPPTDISTKIGNQNRRKLLRAWVEIGSWLVAYERSHQTQSTISKYKPWVQISSAGEEYQQAIGAHHQHIPRGELQSNILQAMLSLRQEWETLGLTPMSYSPELLGFAYHAQCRCNPAKTAHYITALTNIVEVLQNFGTCPSSLQELVAKERSRGRFTTGDIVKAARTLGFGPNGPLGVDHDGADVDDTFIEMAWRDTLNKANEALRILAESKGSKALKDVWDNEKGRLITDFTKQMQKATISPINNTQEAKQVIAEVRPVIV